MPPKKIAETYAAAPYQQIPDRGRGREQLRVLADKTGDLQAERQAVDREQRQRHGRNAEHRCGHIENRVAGGAEPDRSGSRRGEGNYGIVARCEANVGFAVALPDGDRGAIVRQTHRLRHREAFELRV
jgi:hypothetical protein